MLWLLILALGVFVWRQHVALKRLEAKLDESILLIDALRRLVTDPGRRAAPASDAEPVSRTVGPQTPSPARAFPPASPTAPETSSAPVSPTPSRVQPEILPAPPAALRPAAMGTPIRPPSSKSPPTWTSISTWLAENGLAWIGGGGLALGGLLLVAYAAQKGVFTPPLRIAAAVALGGLMIAASEWILRQKRAPGGRHLLAAAVAAGAGAVTLYGAVCAAYALYDMLPFAAAAGLGALISLGLFGLSLRHGEPLALLAVVGAVITPAVTGMDDWSPLALHAYALLIGVTGFSISAVRRWDRAGFATIGGLLLWSLAPQFGGGAALLVLAVIGPVCSVLWRRRSGQDDPADPGSVAYARQPAAALALTTLVSANLWLGDLSGVAHLPQAALVAGFLIAAGAAMTRLGLTRPEAFAAPVAMTVAASLFTLALHGHNPRLAAQLPWIHALTALIPLAALVTGLQSAAKVRTILLGVGGIGVATLASLSWLILDQTGATLAWAPPAALAAALFAASVLIARRVEQPTTDRGLGLWLAAAAELAFLSIHAAVPAHLEPAAFAVATLLLAIGAGRLSWRGLAQTSVVGGLAALITLLRPEFIGAAVEGRLPLPVALAVSVGASTLLFLAARLTPSLRAPNRNEAEAQGAAALAVLLTGLFIGLQVALAGTDSRAGSGELFEGALRTLILLSAGLILTARQRSDDGPIARWRTIITVSAGVVHGLFVQGLVWNPWWGAGAPPAGLPVFNTLVLPFLAPAILLAATAWRRRPVDGWARAWLSAGALFAFLWILMVVRHLFQGAGMGGFYIGRAEACAYAVLLLLTARVFAEERLGQVAGRTGWLRRIAAPVGLTALAFADERPGDTPGRTSWLRNAALPVGWTATVFAALIFSLLASPWWGLSQAPLASPLGGVLLFGLYAAGAAAAWSLGRRSERLGRPALTLAFVITLLLVAHLLRWAFHGAAMSPDGIGRAEAAAYAVAALLVVRLLLSDRIKAASDRTEWLRQAAPMMGWVALAGAAWVFGVYASPWWGPLQEPIASTAAAVLLFGLYGAGAAAFAGLSRSPSAFGKAAIVGVVGVLFALMSLLIRWAFHGRAMSEPAPGGGLETWTFSALWAVFGLATLSLGTARREAALRWAGLAVLAITAAKVLIFDLARLEGVVRAASFLAVGALFLVGALAVRRLNAGSATGTSDLGQPDSTDH